MKLSLFRSTKEPDTFGFTVDPTGRNLPAKFGIWEKYGEAIQTGTGAGLGSSEMVLRMIERDGFYVTRSGEMTVTQTLQSESPN